MSSLDNFLELGISKDITKEISFTVSGKEYTVKIRAMSEEEHREFQKRATMVSKKNFSFDLGKYNSLAIPTCIVEPNFNSAEFLEKAKCVSAWDFINSRFPAGVVEDIAQQIQELSGFKPFELEVEEAKN